ncbi:2-hydroxyacid dehydrogenase [Chengkuizengella axinellae]|uniref:D-glycerate dehydrogenase n=1 Tax=Chengkuizengella axinellae TaxID=3064388 RepID=A0ABT9IV83_9BACL|nr:D-glycerate dehydrogenase [Chengkuizengella sp. 2205SS18-9]MDP5273260.1 D-glycerate dehydrogenase [Chengkuizengella sp. 2205SS18-9]
MKKPYVYITRNIPEEVIAPLKTLAEINVWEGGNKKVPADILKREAAKSIALFTTLDDNINKSLIENSPNLKVIANMAVGYDNIDVSAATKHGVFICNTPGILSDTTADLAFALLMSTARRIVEGNQFIKEGYWKDWGPLLMVGRDIHHKTLGIVGMGRIGEKVAKRAAGFDMQVLYHNRSRKEEVEETLNVTYCTFEELLEKSDFVVNLLPLTEETKNKFDSTAFSKMKNEAIFINVGRGLTVEEDDLLDALNKGEIAGAGLDVFRQEPISNQHPLINLDQVVAVPHIGSASIDTRYAMMRLAVQNIVNVLQGKYPEAYVNKDVTI